MSAMRDLTSGVPHPTVIISIGANSYLLDEIKAVVSPLEGAERYLPATSLPLINGTRTSPAADILDRSGFESDDVWTEEFLQVVLVHGTEARHGDRPARPNTLQLPEDILLPMGPYILHSSTGHIFSVLKLCEDVNNAFVGGVLRDVRSKARYKWLEASTSIPVPSKLYFDQPNQRRPLSGMRFGVKDSIDVVGLKTGNGSKGYRELSSPRESTAACIDRLIAAGAVLVGKMRCSQWCDGQDPLERLEEVTPTNPRGDGFQKPSGSSSGSAAGCASYEWLDFTIGTDTGGSVRHPAGVNGVYGIRPSTGSMESSGLVSCALTDTPGVFARSAHVAEAVTKVMLRDDLLAVKKAPVSKPRYKLLYLVEPDTSEPTETPKFFSRNGSGPEAGTPAGNIMESFVRQLEEYLGCRRQEVCIFDLWKETHPEGVSDDLVGVTGDVYKNVVYGNLSRNVIQPFVQEYKERFGKSPFIEANTKARLEHGASVTDADLEASVASLRAFSGWINDILISAPSSDGEEIPLLVYPQGWGRPQYRDDLGRLKTGQIFWSGFSAYSLSYSSGCPDYTLPLGEVEFASKITGRGEYLPVSISLMGPRNMDATLLELTKELEAVGILKPVDCGSRL